MSEHRTTVGIIGAGTMGTALLSGILRAGHRPEDVVVSTRRPENAARLAREHGVRAGDNRTAAAADIVLIGVKPADVTTVLSQVSEELTPSSLVVSVAAGVTTRALESVVGDGVPVVRVMPNTPATVGAGMSAISGGSAATTEHLQAVRDLLGATGEVVEVAEYQQDAATGVSGSGPAYVFLVAEAMTEAGVTAGLPRAVASRLVAQTLLGAATMLSQPDAHPGLLREQVTSPGGTTAAGLRALEEHGLRAAFMDAVTAAAARSGELSAQD